MRVFLFVATMKGLSVLKALTEAAPGAIAGVCSFREENVATSFYDKIKGLAEESGAQFHAWREISGDVRSVVVESNATHVIAVGWRFLLPTELNNDLECPMLVFHDSILPKYRGFAPLPTAIINGESEVGLTETWSMGVRFDDVSTLLSHGSALRFRFSRQLGGATVATGIHVDVQRKSGSDLWLGTRWNAGPARLRVQLTILDFLNDFIFETQNAAVQAQVDSTVVYERQPIALRTGGDVALSDRVRVEVYGTVVLPSQVVVFEEEDRAAGFTLD
ncbi:MAG: hypothetical protein IIC73_08505, partial [Armatimonadetes bacterium]|nr:hypothetical protein [Armatimonadota bacterium]